MDDTVAKLTTPESCEQFALNVEARSPDRAREARRRAVQLRAAAHSAKTEVEREALEAVYAYERALAQVRGKKVRASRTWGMIDRRGLIPAIEHIVSRPTASQGYHTLASMGMQDMAFEAVVVRHPEVFSAEAVSRSRIRLKDWSG